MKYKKNNSIRKIEKLEKQLREECVRKNLTDIGSFTFQFNAEDGRNIRYVKDMSIEETGNMKEFYDKNSLSYDTEYKSISWPYTGFVQGNMAGWLPIPIFRIVKWIENSPVYTIERFINHFNEEIAELRI